MLVKLMKGVAVAALLPAVWWGTPVGSYARLGWGWLGEAASDAVPLEVELQRAQQMIDDLEPEIQKHAKSIARDKIELARLQKQADTTAADLDKAKSDVTRLADDLKRGEGQYAYGGKTYTAAEVKEDLSGRFQRLKGRSATHEKLGQMVAARESSLRSASDRLQGMLEAKNQLEVEIENLQARVASLRVAQTASESKLDDSHLAKTRSLLDDLASRVEVEEEVAAAPLATTGSIDLDATADDNLFEELAEFLGSDASAAAEVSTTAESASGDEPLAAMILE
jgi:chromosome segregation ATPase